MKPFKFIRKTQNLILLFLLVLFHGMLYADGLIIIQPPTHGIHTHRPFPLEVVYHRVDVTVEDQLATTEIDQAFYNPTARRLEGYYLFPIPFGAVMKNFTMWINGKETAAELLDAKKARKLYEDIVRKQRDPALFEYSDLGLYKVRIFPIEPHEKKKISLKYQELLRKDGETREYLYPLNTEKFSAKPLKDVRIQVDVRSQEKIKNVFSPTHDVDIVRKDDHHAVISYEAQDTKPDLDFKLYYDVSPSKIGLSLLSYQGEDAGYFLLSASPALKFKDSDIHEKDITFVFDASGSMAGEKLEQAKEALAYCVHNLNPGDRFEIIRFSTEANGLFRDLVRANQTNRHKAIDFIEDLRAIGGTHIEEALQMALATRKNDDRPHLVIFITDGKPTIGETDEDKLLAKIEEANPGRIRIFTFGIGNEINTHLLDKMTEQTHATRSYISPSEDIEIKISQFYDKVQSPILTNLTLDFGGIEVYQTYPKHLPDLFKGSNITVLGRYKGDGKVEIKLSGTLNDKKQSFRLDADFVNKDMQHNFIPTLWASRRIGYLLDQIRLHGEDKELVDEVTELARTYGIVTPYTSYLILEDEEARVAHREIRDDLRTLSGIGAMPSSTKKEFETDFRAIRNKSGAQSVQASEEFQALNEAMNLAQTRQGKKRMNYKSAVGESRNLTQQVKNVIGRAFYQTDRFWVDSQLQVLKTKNKVRIQFGTDAYFELFRKKPKAAQFLALGQNVRFYLGETFYEIYE